MYLITADNMLKQLIEEEFALCQQAGIKIKFAAVVKKRILLSTILLPLGLLAMVAPPFGVLLLLAYVLSMLGTKNHKYIFNRAKNEPDTDVREIIKRELAK